MFERTIKFCDSFLDKNVPGFDLAIYKSGSCILRHTAGYRDFENKIPMRGDERYNIYSASKFITCVAAMQLWEKGLFSLEDKLSKYMPEFENMSVREKDGSIRPARSSILVKHLFEMSAGFNYNVELPEIIKCRKETNGRCPTRELMRYLAKEPLDYDPGEKWAYSLCHDALAAFVEVVAGEKFEDYVKKNVFDVLSMDSSTFMLPDSELDTVTEQYIFRNNVLEKIDHRIQGYKFGSEYASGGAGCISTVDDYVKFLEGFRTFKFLQPETVELMTTDRLTDGQRLTYTKPEYGWGLGIRCKKKGGKYVDYGWGGAAGAFLAVDPVNELTVYFGCHLLDSPVQGIRASIYKYIHAELFDESDFENIEKELKEIYNYTLTY